MTTQLPSAVIDFARNGSRATIRVHDDPTDSSRNYLVDAVEWAMQPGITHLLIELDSPTLINPTYLQLLRHARSRLRTGQIELIVTVATTAQFRT